MSRPARRWSAYRLEPSERADGHSRNRERGVSFASEIPNGMPRPEGQEYMYHHIPATGDRLRAQRGRPMSYLIGHKASRPRNLSPLRLPDHPRWLELSWPTLAAHGSDYLLTHRSWTSLIGTGFRKWSFSRPRRSVVTRPASSSRRKRFMTPKRVIGRRCSSTLNGLPVGLAKLVEEAPSHRVGECPEHPCPPLDDT
jgi:hypothetical protein